MTSTYNYSLSSDFGGTINIKQLHSEIENDEVISPNVDGIYQNNDDIGIQFTSALSGVEQTVLNGLVSAHIATPELWNTLEFKTITDDDSPYNVHKKSVLCDTSSGNITIKLPKAKRNKNLHIGICKLNVENIVTINTNGSDQIDGASSKILTGTYEWIVIYSDGNNWILGNGTEGSTMTEINALSSITNEKGDIIVDDGGSQSTLPIGSNDESLIADSTTDLGIKWGQINHTKLSNIGTNTHAQIDAHLALTNEHLDWTTDQGSNNVHQNNITESSIVQHEGAINHDNLLGFITNEHLDWTTDQGSNNVHQNNITESSIVQHEGAITIGNLTGSPAGSVVGTTDAQTLTNKTINTASNTLIITTADITSGTFANARIAASNVIQHEGAINHDNLLGFITNEHLDWTTDQGSNNVHPNNITESSIVQHEGAITIGNLTGSPAGSVVGTTDAQILTNKTFTDDTLFFQDNVDNTKKLQLQLSGITTATTRTLTIPNVSDTIVCLSATQTLTNKTLTSPIIGTINNTGTLTLPTSTDTLVGRSTTDTLTNKTINTASNTLILATADITSGTFADARIAASNVIQHEGAINHDNLLGFITNEHLDWTTDQGSNNIHQNNIPEVSVIQYEGGINHDNLSGYVANKHIDHTEVSITGGEGLNGGGTIAANRTINLDINSLTVDASPDGASDYIVTYDASATSHKKVLLNNLPGGGSLPTTTKGDLAIHNGSTNVRFAVGSDGEILIADSTQTEGVKWDVIGQSACTQIRRTTTATLTTTFTNITFDATDIQTDSSVVEHNTTNTDRIDVKATGVYKIHYHIDTITTAAGFKDVQAKVIKNGSTTIAGSETEGPNYGTGSSTIYGPATRTVIANLSANDYITVQARITVGTGDTRFDPTFSVTKLDGSLAGPVGPAGADGDITWEGTWSSQNYTANQAVEYNGTSYVCKLNTISNEVPTNTTYWDVMASKGDTGEQGIQGPVGPMAYLDFQGIWTSQNYTADQAVLYQDEGYVCILDTVSNETPSNATYWSKFASKGADGAPGAGSTIILKNDMVNIANTPHTTLNFAPGSITVTDVDGDIATIEAIRGSNYKYVEDLTLITTTTTTFTQKLRLTTDSVPAGDYMMEWFYKWRRSSYTAHFIRRIQLDDTTDVFDAYTAEYHINYTDANLRQVDSGFRQVTLTSGVHTFDFDYRMGGSGTLYIYDVYMKFYRVS